MKKLRTILSVAVLALGIAATSAGPSSGPTRHIRAPIALAGSAATNILGPVIQLPANGIFSFETKLAATNSNTANVTYVWRYSITGTNWTTLNNQSSVVALNGTAGVVAVNSVTNIYQPVLAQLWYITNAAAASGGGCVITNVTSTTRP
jgi:hypothetical protein